MAPILPSPRLPGVLILRAEATGPEFARWKREIKIAFMAKQQWGHCDGSNPMPMPGAGPNFFSPDSVTNTQATLLADRKAWVKMDREVKLDIFLSVSDDIKLEVFEVGPPLPPSALTAKEMLEALDAHFDGFKFEDYHHVFCHFMNLHIDQYSNLEEFNAEFKATLDDLHDHGHPLSNIQACSAYFSKLRCTQNPWVAKQIKAWDAREQEPQLAQLMKKSPPWSIIRPLSSSKPTVHRSLPNSIPEEPPLDTPSQSDGEDTHSEHSVSTVASKPSHSRDSSSATQKSQEITIHASYEDLTELQLQFPDVPNGLVTDHVPKRVSSITKISKIAMHTLPPINRPLPPIPAPQPTERARSTSPASMVSTPKKKIASPTRLPSPTGSLQGLEKTHPVLRSPLPKAEMPTELSAEAVQEPTITLDQLEYHPSNRSTRTPSPSPPRILFPPPRQASLPTKQEQQTLQTLPATTFIPTPTSSNNSIQASPQPSHIAALMRATTPSPPPSAPMITLAPPDSLSRPTSSRSAITHQETLNAWAQTRPLLRIESESSSVLSLPLQGAPAPERSVTPEFADTTITETPVVKKAATAPAATMSSSRVEQAKLRFEARNGAPAGLRALPVPSEDEKRARKRSMSWSIKARLSARHGIKEII